MNFLFWNTAKRDLDINIIDLVDDTKAEIITLAEYSGDPLALLKKLRDKGHQHLLVPNLGCERITILSSIPSHCIQPKFDSDRFTIKELQLGGNIPILFVALHLPSKLHLSEDDQLLRATNLREEIERIEAEIGHDNTIALGDFNMNPFDKGMISANGLNSIPCAITAKKGSRTIDGKEYRFFYNPSWNLLGDNRKPPGTYFHKSPSVLSHYWNTLDQVIVRPNLSSRVTLDNLRALEIAGEMNLFGEGRVPRASDHLPLIFTINPKLELS